MGKDLAEERKYNYLRKRQYETTSTSLNKACPILDLHLVHCFICIILIACDIIRIFSGYFQMRNPSSGYCLDSLGAKPEHNARVGIYVCHGQGGNQVSKTTIAPTLNGSNDNYT